MRVLIAGAGRAGLNVAVHLRETGHDVTVVDRDEAITRRAFEQYGLVALAGDATDPAILKEAEAGLADVVVAMLRTDAENLAVALLGRAAGAKRVLVRMRSPDYRTGYEAAGIHRILSETEVIIGALATAIEHEAVRNAMILGSGESVAVELLISEQSPVVGRSVSDIASDPNFPSSCVFAGMVKQDGGYEAPRGASVLQGNMTLLVVASRAQLSEVVDFFLPGSALKSSS
jgi:trk system potassium uptake protein